MAIDHKADIKGERCLLISAHHHQEVSFIIISILLIFSLQAGITNTAVSLASSPRLDLALMYGRLIVQTADFANDGIKIMIDNGWLEEPPRYVDRSELVNTTKH
ncbi:MAG: DUF3231 family protein [Desulfotomaculaceae bacterium]|nr:DUF3231 family protein [Desulfotomaculaceae bacterium]